MWHSWARRPGLPLKFGPWQSGHVARWMRGCATTVLVTGAGIGEMALQMLVGWVFQAQGSYSFLVCGVIFGCLAFAFYILLLFFHRMHPGLSSVLTQDKALGMESSECYQR